MKTAHAFTNKDTVTTNSSHTEFEDTLYNPELVVVQKDFTGHLSHTQVVYVFNDVKDEMPEYAIFREISEDGTDYWKETYNA